MEKIELTTWERVQLMLAVGSPIAGQGTVAAVRLGCKALDVLEFTEEEKMEIEFVFFPNGDMHWRKDAPDWPLEFSDDVWDFIKQRTKTHQNWPINRLTGVLLDKILGENDE